MGRCQKDTQSSKLCKSRDFSASLKHEGHKVRKVLYSGHLFHLARDEHPPQLRAHSPAPSLSTMLTLTAELQSHDDPLLQRNPIISISEELTQEQGDTRVTELCAIPEWDATALFHLHHSGNTRDHTAIKQCFTLGLFLLFPPLLSFSFTYFPLTQVGPCPPSEPSSQGRSEQIQTLIKLQIREVQS